MEEGDVVVWMFVPADQDTPEAVQPAVSTLQHPPAGLEARFPFDGLGLLAPAANVGGEPKLLYALTYLIKVVAFIQAKTLRQPSLTPTLSSP